MDPMVLAALELQTGDVTTETVAAWRQVLAHLTTLLRGACETLHTAGVDARRTRPVLGWIGMAQADLRGSFLPTKTESLVKEGAILHTRIQRTLRTLPGTSRAAERYLRRVC